MSFRLVQHLRRSLPGPSVWRTYSTSNVTSSRARTLLSIPLLAGFSLTAYSIGSIYPPPTVEVLFPRPAPAPPSDPDSLESQKYTQALELELHKLPGLTAHRALPDSSDWYEVRPYQNFPEERRVNNLSAGALRGPGKLAVLPLVRCKKDDSESIVFIHLGRGLCGHDGIIHGGLLATLLDETLARTAISNLPDKIGVTANLSLNYRAPTKADQWIVIRTRLEATKGRKAEVTGTVQDLNGATLVEARATFVQPKYAKLLMMNNRLLSSAMGERPEDPPVHLADGQIPPASSSKQ